LNDGEGRKEGMEEVSEDGEGQGGDQGGELSSNPARFGLVSSPKRTTLHVTFRAAAHSYASERAIKVVQERCRILFHFWGCVYAT
jgi:hypothetical protein